MSGTAKGNTRAVAYSQHFAAIESLPQKESLLARDRLARQRLAPDDKASPVSILIAEGFDYLRSLVRISRLLHDISLYLIAVIFSYRTHTFGELPYRGLQAQRMQMSLAVCAIDYAELAALNRGLDPGGDIGKHTLDILKFSGGKVVVQPSPLRVLQNLEVPGEPHGIFFNRRGAPAGCALNTNGVFLDDQPHRMLTEGYNGPGIRFGCRHDRVFLCA